MAEKLFDVGLNKQTKQILVIAGIGLAALAVYEFAGNAGTTAGEGIGTGIGAGATDAAVILSLAGAGALIVFFLI
jgi:hypothetical protein